MSVISNDSRAECIEDVLTLLSLLWLSFMRDFANTRLVAPNKLKMSSSLLSIVCKSA